MKKKKIIFHSNQCKSFTGFGKNAKNILTYLYKTGKYELIEACNGVVANQAGLERRPWKCVGLVPEDPAVRQQWEQDPGKGRAMHYGAALIDDLIREEKPDIYIGAEDIWAFENYWDKKWWNKVNSMIWTTLDSLPLLPMAVAAAPKIKNYFVWATFAEKAMSELGHPHVRTLRGSLDTEVFYRLEKEERQKLRSQHNLNNEFVVGFVFRNQLRKSVPNILDGFKLFIDKHPKANARLLLHTHWGEGWDIPRLLNEKNIDPSLILTTYFCPSCGKYEIKPFQGQNLNCRFCGAQNSQVTTNVNQGVSDAQLNEIYNLMDVYCHPFTSGGQEIPVQEAKLTELVTLVTNYSCGEDSCTPESAGLPLDWSEYREPGTQFIKATTSKRSIERMLTRVFKMKPQKKRELEKQAREWVLNNFSIDVIGPKLEKILDKMPECKWDFDFQEPLRNPQYNPPPIENNSDWLIDIYKNILRVEIDPNYEGHKSWMQGFAQGKDRQTVLNFFKETAEKENAEILGKDKVKLKDLLDDTSEKRLVVVMPGTIGDVYMTTSLLPSLSKLYPEYAVYFATQPAYFPILNGNPHIYKCIPYDSKFDNLLFLEGQGDEEGFFDIAFLPTIGTQKMFNYQHNAQDRIEFELCTS